MLKAFILSLIICCPNHELNKNSELLDEVVGYFESAGEQYNIEPSLLAYWFYLESSLKITAKGKLGEIGYSQVHGIARRTCREGSYNPETREGSIYCGAMLMDEGRRFCGSLEKGLRWYASGSCNKAKRLVKWRLKKLKRLLND